VELRPGDIAMADMRVITSHGGLVLFFFFFFFFFRKIILQFPEQKLVYSFSTFMDWNKRAVAP
jgi:hypothetical protein